MSLGIFGSGFPYVMLFINMLLQIPSCVKSFSTCFDIMCILKLHFLSVEGSHCIHGEGLDEASKGAENPENHEDHRIKGSQQMIIGLMALS